MTARAASSSALRVGVARRLAASAAWAETDYAKAIKPLLKERSYSRSCAAFFPGQPWLDGFSVGAGLIRQFVATPLGAGDSVEEQLTGRADHSAGMGAGLPRANFWH